MAEPVNLTDVIRIGKWRWPRQWRPAESYFGRWIADQNTKPAPTSPATEDLGRARNAEERINDGRDAVFRVTAAGYDALYPDESEPAPPWTVESRAPLGQDTWMMVADGLNVKAWP